MLPTAAYVNQIHLKLLLILHVEFPIISRLYDLPFLVKVSEGFYRIILARRRLLPPTKCSLLLIFNDDKLHFSATLPELLLWNC
jgi:hypothetical protein